MKVTVTKMTDLKYGNLFYITPNHASCGPIFFVVYWDALQITPFYNPHFSPQCSSMHLTPTPFSLSSENKDNHKVWAPDFFSFAKHDRKKSANCQSKSLGLLIDHTPHAGAT